MCTASTAKRRRRQMKLDKRFRPTKGTGVTIASGKKKGSK